MRFTLDINCGSESFCEDPSGQFSSIFRAVSRQIDSGQEDGAVVDTNGNTIGQWRLIEEMGD